MDEQGFSVYLGDEDHPKPITRRSLWRYWNQLSSLQRSIVYTLLIVAILIGLFIFPPFIDDTEAFIARPPERKPIHNMKQFDEFLKEDKEISQRKIVNEKEQKLVPLKKDVLDSSKNDSLQYDIKDTFIKQFQNQSIHAQTFTGPENDQQKAVVNAFLHGWNAYRKYAWGKDELHPVSKSYGTWFGIGLTLIDSLDTLYIMGLKDEFEEARNWLEKTSFEVDKDVNLFECTIRVLGSLLSTYHLSGDELFLHKARDIGDRLLPAFQTSSGIPYSDVNLKTHRAHAPKWGPDSSTSEVTTIQIEFRELSWITGDPKYMEAADKVSETVHKIKKNDGLVPIFINANTGKFRSSATITLGARGDSYYEYLFKGWLHSGKRRNDDKHDYLDAIEGIEKHLMKHSKPNNHLFIGELVNGRTFSPKMDHLVCYLGGLYALSAKHDLGHKLLDIGKQLTETCYKIYQAMPTGLSPEITHFNMAEMVQDDFIIKTADAHNLKRPETVESLFVLYRVTGDKKYQEWGWQIFQAFEKYSKLKEGYSSIQNVKNKNNIAYRDKMESFFLAETLKYLYLLFSDDPKLIDLDKWVFNTEAHPLPIHV